MMVFLSDSQAKLFAVVHHKYLTGLIGYCDDGTNMALIYEYMSNGDLAKHLSGIVYDCVGTSFLFLTNMLQF
jgi:hypothetical protein